MSFATLTFTKSSTEIVSGIPEFVGISSSVSALIYYTLDGTLPTMFSSQYLGSPIKMPTSNATVTLSAVAYVLDGYENLVPGSVFSETYALPDHYASRVRNMSFEGISYMYPGGLNIPFWYDYDGNPLVYISVPLEDFLKELTPSYKNADGSIRTGVDGGLVQRVTRPLSAEAISNESYSNPSGNGYFNPNSLLVVIDGREARSVDDVLLMNSPYMSLRDPEKNFTGVDFYNRHGTNYVSGSLTKFHYNRSKGVIVFYYFDSNTGRWIKSIQNLPKANAVLRSNAIITNPVVFEWMLCGRQQAI